MAQRYVGPGNHSLASLPCDPKLEHVVILSASRRTLPETQPDPVAMFIVPADADEAYEVALVDMTEARPECVHGSGV